MYGLAKLANEQQDNRVIETAGNAALAAGGAGALAASHDRLLGRQKLYRNMTGRDWDLVNKEGYSYTQNAKLDPGIHLKKSDAKVFGHKQSPHTVKFNLPYNPGFTLVPEDYYVNSHIAPRHIIGSPEDLGYVGRLKESFLNMPGYIKDHPKRFATGAGLAGAGLAGLGLAAYNQLTD